MIREYEYRCEPCHTLFPMWGYEEDGIITNQATGDEHIECPDCGSSDVSKVT